MKISAIWERFGFGPAGGTSTEALHAGKAPGDVTSSGKTRSGRFAKLLDGLRTEPSWTEHPWQVGTNRRSQRVRPTRYVRNRPSTVAEIPAGQAPEAAKAFRPKSGEWTPRSAPVVESVTLPSPTPPEAAKPVGAPPPMSAPKASEPKPKVTPPVAEAKPAPASSTSPQPAPLLRKVEAPRSEAPPVPPPRKANVPVVKGMDDHRPGDLLRESPMLVEKIPELRQGPKAAEYEQRAPNAEAPRYRPGDLLRQSDMLREQIPELRRPVVTIHGGDAPAGKGYDQSLVGNGVTVDLKR